MPAWAGACFWHGALQCARTASTTIVWRPVVILESAPRAGLSTTGHSGSKMDNDLLYIPQREVVGQALLQAHLSLSPEAMFYIPKSLKGGN